MTAIGDSIVMTILLSPKTANYISLIGDIHYGSPNSHIYFTYIQPLFHYGNRVDALYFLLSYNLYFIFILLTISVLSIVYVDYFPYLYKIL